MGKHEGWIFSAWKSLEFVTRGEHGPRAGLCRYALACLYTTRFFFKFDNNKICIISVIYHIHEVRRCRILSEINCI